MMLKISFFFVFFSNFSFIIICAHFKTMTKNAKEDEAAFFLFRLQGNKNWLLLTFVPDGVSVLKIEEIGDSFLKDGLFFFAKTGEG